MLIDTKLDGKWHTPGMCEDALPDPEVSDFLDLHPTAKIIVVVDTHSVDGTGGFLWNSKETGEIESCSLYDVSGTPRIHHAEPH